MSATRLATPAALMGLGLLASLGACNGTAEDEEDCSEVTGATAPGTAPSIPLDGLWRGAEVTYLDEPAVLWAMDIEEVERYEVEGSFTSDWPFHVRNYPDPDTIRGSVSGSYCMDELSLTFEMELPGSWANPRPTRTCRYEARIGRRRDRIDGIVVCYDQEGVPYDDQAALSFFLAERG